MSVGQKLSHVVLFYDATCASSCVDLSGNSSTAVHDMRDLQSILISTQNNDTTPAVHYTAVFNFAFLSYPVLTNSHTAM